MKIKLTNLSIGKDENNNVKAYASIEADGMVIKGIRLLESNNNLRLSFPSHKTVNKETGQEEYIPYVFAEKEIYMQITDMIKKGYEQVKVDNTKELDFEIETPNNGINLESRSVGILNKEYEKAITSVAYGDLKFTNIKLIEGKQNNIFLSYPQMKSGDKYVDCFYPNNNELREELTDTILEKYIEKSNNIEANNDIPKESEENDEEQDI